MFLSLIEGQKEVIHDKVLMSNLQATTLHSDVLNLNSMINHK